jgi:hypothetical protein
LTSGAQSKACGASCGVLNEKGTRQTHNPSFGKSVALINWDLSCFCTFFAQLSTFSCGTNTQSSQIALNRTLNDYLGTMYEKNKGDVEFYKFFFRM